ncbi:hypothetical protein KIW84_071616 [Lathyrus oleraceus]|uniref:Uncharacterized protein n=1 Tax=Pisum sativum TaxID=3888 RepID=A0A9D4VIR2_PEA|nr:hypothetical protein KIW84_071616 [Pisum sativum]
MYVTFLFKFLRNVKYEEALEKFESVLGTKLEPNEAAVAGFELPRCKQCSHIHNCHGATTTTSSCTDFLSPVYVPHMAVPEYSNSDPYPHPTNGNYVLMPRGGSHVNANNLKYGVQQFKPVPAGNPTGFGNFANPAGYAMLAPGVVGGASGLEDSSRVKYKDNLYVPNLQLGSAEYKVSHLRNLFNRIFQ